MGKATLLNGGVGSNGLYMATLHYDTNNKTEIIAALEAEKVQNAIQQAESIDRRDAALLAVQNLGDAFNSAISDYYACLENVGNAMETCANYYGNIQDYAKQRIESASHYADEMAVLTALKVRSLEIVYELADWYNQVKDSKYAPEIWSVDNVGALVRTGNRATIEVMALKMSLKGMWLPYNHQLIAPLSGKVDYGAPLGQGETYDCTRHGRLRSIYAQGTYSAMSNLLNLTLAGSHNPRHLIGKLVAISGSGHEGIGTVEFVGNVPGAPYSMPGYSPEKYISGIPFEYMNCGADAFEVDDAVVVRFSDAAFGHPAIIGFRDHPRACPHMIFIESGAIYIEQETPYDAANAPETVLQYGTEVAGYAAQTLEYHLLDTLLASDLEIRNAGTFRVTTPAISLVYGTPSKPVQVDYVSPAAYLAAMAAWAQENELPFNRRQTLRNMSADGFTGLMKLFMAAWLGSYRVSEFSNPANHRVATTFSMQIMQLGLSYPINESTGIFNDPYSAHGYWMFNIGSGGDITYWPIEFPTGSAALLSALQATANADERRRLLAYLFISARFGSKQSDSIAAQPYPPLAWGWKFNSTGTQAAIVLCDSGQLVSKSVVWQLAIAKTQTGLSFTLTQGATSAEFVKGLRHNIFVPSGGGQVRSDFGLSETFSTTGGVDPSPIYGNIPLYCLFDASDTLMIATISASFSTGGDYDIYGTNAGLGLVCYDSSPWLWGEKHSNTNRNTYSLDFGGINYGGHENGSIGYENDYTFYVSGGAGSITFHQQTKVLQKDAEGIALMIAIPYMSAGSLYVGKRSNISKPTLTTTHSWSDISTLGKEGQLNCIFVYQVNFVYTDRTVEHQPDNLSDSVSLVSSISTVAIENASYYVDGWDFFFDQYPPPNETRFLTVTNGFGTNNLAYDSLVGGVIRRVFSDASYNGGVFGYAVFYGFVGWN